MKTAAKIMYIIGIITNILIFIGATIMSVIFIVSLVNPEVAEQIRQAIGDAAPALAGVIGAGTGLTITMAVIALIVLILSFRAIHNLNKGNGKVLTHILLLIGGVLVWDIFYILGGIFGIIGSKK